MSEVPYIDGFLYANTAVPKGARSFVFASNPLGPCDGVKQLIRDKAHLLSEGRYPSGDSVASLRDKLAEIHKVSPSSIIISDGGSNTIIQEILTNRSVISGGFVVTPEATFPGAAVAAGRTSDMLHVGVRMRGDYRIDFYGIRDELNYQAQRGEAVAAVFLCNPNSPTGKMEETSRVVELSNSFKDVPFIVSEANIDVVYADVLSAKGGSLLNNDGARNILRTPSGNIIVTRTFSKDLGLAGLPGRLGYAVCSSDVSGRYANRDPFISQLYAEAAILALDDVAHRKRSGEFIRNEVARISEEFRFMGFSPVSSDSNLLLVPVPNWLFSGDADRFAADLCRNHGVCVVACSRKEFGNTIGGTHIRIAPGTEDDNAFLVSAVQKVVKEHRPRFYRDIGRRPQPIFGKKVHTDVPQLAGYAVA